MELHWYPEMATVDIGGDMDAYLERMSRPYSRIRWDMRTWWFTQQVPSYRFHWNQIDRPIWMALLIHSPQLFSQHACSTVHVVPLEYSSINHIS
jgi:hypothetical protein